jgi:hypothetical protein
VRVTPPPEILIKTPVCTGSGLLKTTLVCTKVG